MLQATSALTLSLLPAAAPLPPVSGTTTAPAPASGPSTVGGSSASTSSGSASSSPSAPSSSAPASASTQALSADQERQIAWLQSRDREVRAHESAHQAAGGSLVAGVSFQFQTGPDGRSYAVGGDVTIDASTVPGNPQATVAKMRQVRDAALAPAQPSAQDEMVAAQAEELELEAEMEEQLSGATTRAPASSAQAAGASQGAAAPAPAPAPAPTALNPAGGVLQSHMIAAYAAAQATVAAVGTPPPIYV
jgi:hypothetical protein